MWVLTARSILSLFFVCLSLAADANEAFAGRSDPLQIRQMAREADLIFEGIFVRKETFKANQTIVVYKRDENEQINKRELLTDYVFEIEEMLKGQMSEKLIKLSQFGGKDGTTTIVFSSFYFLKLDEKYLVFAKQLKKPPHWWVSINGGKGVLQLVLHDGVSYFKDSTYRHPTSKHDKPDHLVRLDISEVRTLIAESLESENLKNSVR